MIHRKSRYRSTPVLTVDDGRGGTQPLLDLLAWRFYRDPTRYWRICDASTRLDPFDVLAPGEPMPIPPDK